MDNSHRFRFMGAPLPHVSNSVGLDEAVYPGSVSGHPPISVPACPTVSAGHSWGNFHPHLPAQHPPWPPFPPFDPSRPPPGLFEPAKHDEKPPSWSRGQWSHQNPPNQPPFTQSVPPTYQPSNVSQMYFPAMQNNPSNDWSWSQFSQDELHSKSPHVTPADEETQQKSKDEQWLKRFLQLRKIEISKPNQTNPRPSIHEFKENLYGTVKMLSELKLLCQTMKDNLENENVWTEALLKATDVKVKIQQRVSDLKQPENFSSIQRKIIQIKKRRVRMKKRKMQLEEEKLEQEDRRAQREAEIDKWQMKRLQEVEEKNREKELKVAADAVLAEVRKKQGDAKRMLDVLKSLEKLRKLRKEAAARKGFFPGSESDVKFEDHLERLRSLIWKRTAVYGKEEKTLRVMLEGEQEEERKRDRDKRLKREREKLLQKKNEIDMMLFGAELPCDDPLQPFHDYYTQAEHSLPALLQIRREWDQFLVPADHPDGTGVPQGWVLPEAPNDDNWATALEK